MSLTTTQEDKLQLLLARYLQPLALQENESQNQLAIGNNTTSTDPNRVQIKLQGSCALFVMRLADILIQLNF